VGRLLSFCALSQLRVDRCPAQPEGVNERRGGAQQRRIIAERAEAATAPSADDEVSSAHASNPNAVGAAHGARAIGDERLVLFLVQAVLAAELRSALALRRALRVGASPKLASLVLGYTRSGHPFVRRSVRITRRKAKASTIADRHPRRGL
jgi:hypothetical protein